MKKPAKAIEIAVVGLGQGGGNIAAELYRRGYPAVALNTAISDLSALASGPSELPAEFCYYIGLEGYDGAGGDAGYGRECIRRHATAIKKRVEVLAQSADALLICAGFGGGTGSAAAELLSALEQVDLPTLVLATLPTEHESAIAKVNAARALNEVVAHHALGLILINNTRLAKTRGGVSAGHYYAEINRSIVEPLDALNHLNGEGRVAIRSFDGEDFRRLLLSDRVVSFSVTQLPRLSAEAMLDAVTEGLLQNDMHPAGYRLEDVTYLGVVVEASESVLANAPFAMFEWLGEQLKAETQGAAVYFGIYRTRSQDPQAATVRVVASSQSIPEGVHAVVEQAAREGGLLQEKLQQSISSLELGKLADLDITRNGNGRRRGLSNNHSKAEAVPAAPSNVVSQTPVQREAEGVIKPRWPVAREAYDQLALEFRGTESDLVRQSVQYRLEQDQKSASALVRYHAVSTMCKLDTNRFQAALRLATQDTDATVRALALKALQNA